MSKYKPIEKNLIASGKKIVVLKFDEIANIIDSELPASAFKHRAWWSNNETNSVIAHAWLDAGYKTRNVDVQNCTLEFHKCLDKNHLHKFDDEQRPHGRELTGVIPENSLLGRVTGILKGTVTVYPDTDLIEPLAEEWNALK